VTTVVATDARYLYGVVGAGTIPPELLAAPRSIDERHPVRVVEVGELAAIVSDVTLDEFGEASVSERLNDPVWLERKARAHEGVLDVALAATDVVPFRFCTIYRSEEDLRTYVESAAAELQALLERFEGCVEAGVKCFVDFDRVPMSDEQDAATVEAMSQGRAYLQRLQQERRTAAERSRIVDDCAATVHERLAAAAIDARLNAPQPPELSGRAEAMILNAAYLVERSNERFRDEVGELAREYERVGLIFEVTGPWPPYNFVPQEPEAL
jgi:gas vesicle protein GvpL/GvpF